MKNLTTQILCVFNMVLNHVIRSMEHRHVTYSMFFVIVIWNTDRPRTKLPSYNLS